jgi:hypothetical protein
MKAIMASGGLLTAGAAVACVTPLWLLNFYWAAKVWVSSLKIAGVIGKPKPEAVGVQKEKR